MRRSDWSTSYHNSKETFQCLASTSHTCAVQIYLHRSQRWQKRMGFQLGLVLYEFGVEHRDVNSRHWTKKVAIKPKICSVTHYVHDKYDDLFLQCNMLQRAVQKLLLFSNSLTNLLRPKDEPNIEREVLVSAWAVEPPVETGAGAKCRTTLLSQTIFGGRSFHFG